MKRKLRLKNGEKHIFSKIIIMILVIISIVFFMLWLANKKLMPLLLNYSKIEIEKILNIVINNSTNRDIINSLDSNMLLTIDKNNNGEIQLLYFDPITVNNFLDAITTNIQNDLVRISNGDMSTINGYESYGDEIAYKFPLGVLTNNMFLSGFGPKIPIKLQLVGFINSNIETNIKEYGINNALIEIYVQIDVKSRIVLPFASDDILVTNKIPVTVKIIQGHVPEYYQNGISSNSNLFSLPMK
ncbi:MAG TPA: sporulation protein YunB [Bacilli bacterium]|nr:sporulation protein YunB [Bacilli bacterium]